MRRQRFLRLALPFVMCAALLAAPVRAQDSSQTIRLAAGAAQTIELGENPSTGYRWRLSETASRNLALVAVADAGYAASPSGRIGAAGTRRFAITARQPGSAVLVFEYARPWESVAPARRHTVTVEIGAR